MRIRCGFVSNSSSASFVVNKANLTPFQLSVVRYHDEAVKMMLSFQREVENPENPKWPSMILYSGCSEDALTFSDADQWDIKETDTEIRGETSMTNLELKKLFQFAGIEAKFTYD